MLLMVVFLLIFSYCIVLSILIALLALFKDTYTCILYHYIQMGELYITKGLLVNYKVVQS